jgi:hypothetical protein
VARFHSSPPKGTHASSGPDHATLRFFYRRDRHKGAVRLFDELSRLAAVQLYESVGEAYLDRLVAWAAQLFGVPISMTGFADRDRIWFKSSHVLDVTEFDREAEMHAPVGFLSRIACGR